MSVLHIPKCCSWNGKNGRRNLVENTEKYRFQMDKSSWSNILPTLTPEYILKTPQRPRNGTNVSLEVGCVEEISPAPIVKIWVKELWSSWCLNLNIPDWVDDLLMLKEEELMSSDQERGWNLTSVLRRIWAQMAKLVRDFVGRLRRIGDRVWIRMNMQMSSCWTQRELIWQMHEHQFHPEWWQFGFPQVSVPHQNLDVNIYRFSPGWYWGSVEVK